MSGNEGPGRSIRCAVVAVVMNVAARSGFVLPSPLTDKQIVVAVAIEIRQGRKGMRVVGPGQGGNDPLIMPIRGDGAALIG